MKAFAPAALAAALALVPTAAAADGTPSPYLGRLMAAEGDELGVLCAPLMVRRGATLLALSDKMPDQEGEAARKAEEHALDTLLHGYTFLLHHRPARAAALRDAFAASEGAAPDGAAGDAAAARCARFGDGEIMDGRVSMETFQAATREMARVVTAPGAAAK